MLNNSIVIQEKNHIIWSKNTPNHWIRPIFVSPSTLYNFAHPVSFALGTVPAGFMDYQWASRGDGVLNFELGTDVRPEVSTRGPKPEKTQICDPCLNHLFHEGPLFFF